MCEQCKKNSRHMVLRPVQEKYYILPSNNPTPQYRTVMAWQPATHVHPGETVGHGDFVCKDGKWEPVGRIEQHTVPHRF